MFESSVSHVSHDDFALQRDSRESMHRETDCWTERETESMSKKGQRNGISVSVKSHRKSCSEESQKILF